MADRVWRTAGTCAIPFAGVRKARENPGGGLGIFHLRVLHLHPLESAGRGVRTGEWQQRPWTGGGSRDEDREAVAGPGEEVGAGQELISAGLGVGRADTEHVVGGV